MTTATLCRSCGAEIPENIPAEAYCVACRYHGHRKPPMETFDDEGEPIPTPSEWALDLAAMIPPESTLADRVREIYDEAGLLLEGDPETHAAAEEELYELLEADAAARAEELIAVAFRSLGAAVADSSLTKTTAGLALARVLGEGRGQSLADAAEVLGVTKGALWQAQKKWIEVLSDYTAPQQ